MEKYIIDILQKMESLKFMLLEAPGPTWKIQSSSKLSQFWKRQAKISDT